MKAGSTFILLVNLDVEMSYVDSIIFTVACGSKKITKDKYTYDLNKKQFRIPFTQEETVYLEGRCFVEAQINFKDKSVAKSSIKTFFVGETLDTKIIEGNEAAEEGTEVSLEVDGAVVYVNGGISDEQIAQAVEDYLEENPIEVEDNIFYVVGSQTTYDEITNAIADGKELRACANPMNKDYNYYFSGTNSSGKYIFTNGALVNNSGYQGSQEASISLLTCENVANAPVYAQWSSYTIELVERKDIYEIELIAKGANKALSFVDYSSMVNAINNLPVREDGALNIGQNIYIQTLDVPDLWISDANPYEGDQYTYTTDEDFINELMANGRVKVGYYSLSALETQKVNLSEYAKTENVYSRTEIDTMFGTYVDEVAELVDENLALLGGVENE